ncbi:MAG: M16 family metallopeptidase [Thiohalomonadales bacterium]
MGLSLFCAFYTVTGIAGTTVYEHNLKNGMKILVNEDHRAPVVVSQVWYRVGSSYEANGRTGLSHVLEHMMFKGSEKYPPGEFSKIIAKHGGRENAFTGKDYTAYFQQLEKSRLKVSMEMEADRMVNLTLPNDEFTKELAVVIEERHLRTDDKPRSKTYEQFNATAFMSSPYNQPIIGWQNDLDNMEIEDLQKWYKQWYSPNNATLVVVGDVNHKEVFEMAEKYYGVIPARAVEKLKPRKEVEQVGERRLIVKAPAKLPYLIMGYKVPSLKTAEVEWEAYALEVLGGILSSGSSSRFPKRLVRDQQIASSADAGFNLYSRQSEIFLIDATPSAGKELTVLEDAILVQIEEMKNSLVSDKELASIKAQVVAANVYERDSIFYQAMQLGTLETVGLGWQRLDEYVSKVREVTAEQIQQVAKKYLIEDRLTVAFLIPQELNKALNKKIKPVHH